MNRLNALMMLALALGCTSAAHAQVAVYDAASVRQSIEQVAAWKRQYDQMRQQQLQLQAQHASMTGSRGFGMIATDPRLNHLAPAELREVLAAIRTKGASGLTPAAAAIRDQTRIYACPTPSGNRMDSCEWNASINAQQQANQERALLLLEQRTRQIQQLQTRINATSDPKAIAELQARLQVEAAQVSNDTNKLLVMNAMMDASSRAAQQADKERELSNLALKSNGLDTFVFQPRRLK